MPKVEGRKEIEAEIAFILNNATQARKDAIVSSMGSPPRVTMRTRELLGNIQSDVATDDELTALLLLLYIAAVGNMRSATGVEVNSVLIARQAKQFAEQRVSDLAESMANTSLDKLSRGSVDAVFNESRSIGTAIGETTNANTKGERAFRDEFNRTTGTEIVFYWRHSGSRPPRHSNAPVEPCWICSPLENHSEWEWPKIHPSLPQVWDGPQAHPH